MSYTTALYEALDRCLAAGETVAVATIVRRRGSSPREVGAKMLIRASGDTDGTVGGACGEADVWRAALDVTADGETRTVVVDLTKEIAMNTDGVWGGIMEIFVEPWAPTPGGLDAGRPNEKVRAAPDGGPENLESDQDARALTRGLLEAVAAKRPAVMATVVACTGQVPSAPGARLLVVDGAARPGGFGWPWLQEHVLADVVEVIAEGRSHVRTYPDESGTVSVYFELALPKPVLVVVGAGHVAVPVAEVGRLLDFDVVVIDDRPSYAKPERFPMADQIVVDDLEAALDALPITRPPTSCWLRAATPTTFDRSARSSKGRPRTSG